MRVRIRISRITIFSVLCCYLMIIFTSEPIQSTSHSIQKMIDQAQPGDTIQLSSGTYQEKLLINKPIHLIGSEHVTFTYQGSDPVITIRSNDVVLENLNLHYISEDKGTGAILVQGDHNELRKITIQTNSYGVYLDESHQNKLTDLVIHGASEALFRERRHGIYVWKSHQNEIKHTQIKSVQDGIYAERSRENKITDNLVTDSRYGYHLMFTKKTVLKNNESYHNVSGMMIMGTEETIARQNILANNRENLQSLGLLLYDVTGADISENHIMYNRIGIMIEEAQDNLLRLNNVQGNYIGLQFRKAQDNHITQNAFIANVSQGQAEESSNNLTNENYWGDHRGMDLTGDGTSDLPHSVDSFFLKLTREYPPFQLLFHTPGMIFLQQLVQTPVDEQMVDQAPLLNNPLSMDSEVTARSIHVLIFSIFLLMTSFIIMYMGVRRQ